MFRFLDGCQHLFAINMIFTPEARHKGGRDSNNSKINCGEGINQIQSCHRMGWHTIFDHQLQWCTLIQEDWQDLINEIRSHMIVTTCPHRVVSSILPFDLVLFVFNTLRPRQNVRHFPDDIFKSIFMNKNVWISINMSLKFVPKRTIISALFQIMAWCRPGDKPLSGPMVIKLPSHICVTQPSWVNLCPADLFKKQFNIFAFSIIS